jgi:hypothetical protein
MDQPLTHEFFAPYVGRTVSFQGSHVVLTLISVTADPQFAMPGSTRVPFSMIFHGPVGDILPGGNYRAAIVDGPEASFYIEPVRTVGTDRQDYQVVFN